MQHHADPASLQPSALARLIRDRRTSDLFQAHPPPPGLIEQAVEVARWAPNHKLTEPWHFYPLGPRSVASVIDLNCELVAASRGAAIADAKRRRWSQVPGWLVVTTRRDDDPLRAREDYAACCCALQNLVLYLCSHGVASKWTTGAVTRHQRFYDLLGIDARHEEVVALLWYGYSAHHPHKPRKPVADILSRRP